MKRLLVPVAISTLALTIWSPPSYSIDIGGRWGLGALLFPTSSSGTQFAIIRGMSGRSALALDVSYRGGKGEFEGGAGIPASSRENHALTLGPRLRRFTRADAEFSPYVDVFLHGLGRVSLASSGGSSQDLRGLGGEVGVALGVEYLTRWHFSIALHSDVATFSYEKDKLTSPLGDQHVTSWDASSGFSPALYLRGYF